MITIFVPVYNEGKILEKNVVRLNDFIQLKIKEYQIIILDSNSKDKTKEISLKLNKKDKRIIYLNNNSKGKGRAIRDAAMKIDSDFYAFMDIDMPIKLEEFVSMIFLVINGKTDICVGSKYVKGSKYKRPIKRIIASKGYNLIARIFLNIPVRDIFMGAKVWNKEVGRTVWPRVVDDKWFFDIEFLYGANRMGFKILEFPVTYSETRADSKLSFSKEGVYLTKKIIRLIRKHFLEKWKIR